MKPLQTITSISFLVLDLEKSYKEFCKQIDDRKKYYYKMSPIWRNSDEGTGYHHFTHVLSKNLLKYSLDLDALKLILICLKNNSLCL
ncbi:MAG: hypothetical protein [Bacteriophage sp.]|nr:MAG: hypothetical protein [Bacteriophage sp.]